MSNYKACPFCNNDIYIETYVSKNKLGFFLAEIECTKCDYTLMHSADTKEEAVSYLRDRWNNRPMEQHLQNIFSGDWYPVGSTIEQPFTYDINKEDQYMHKELSVYTDENGTQLIVGYPDQGSYLSIALPQNLRLCVKTPIYLSV